MAMDWRELHRAWFGDIQITPAYYAARIPYWFFGHSLELDQLCRQRFAPWLDGFGLDRFRDWLATPPAYLSLILLVDQVPRTAYRGDPRAYAYDPIALELCLRALGTDIEAGLDRVERIFLYVPLQHSEDPEHQALCVDRFEHLHDLADDELKKHTQLGVQKTRASQAIIERFGRFPHRNSILGRASRDDEARYLREQARAAAGG